MMMRKQIGLSLVEILVAMVISIFLLGGVVQMYTGNKATYNFSEAVSRIQENGRFALDSITRDIRMAGFRGCATTNYTNNLDINDPGYDPELHDFFNEPAIEGTENLGVNNSDSLTVRGAMAGQASILPPYNSPTSGQIFSNVAGFVQAGDIVLLSNCKGADVFQVTNITNGAGASKLSVVHNTGAGTPGNFNPSNCSGGNAHCLSQTYGGDSALLKMQTVTYSIALGASGEPALFRTEFTNPTSELVDGIEQMQVLYGVNTSNSNTVPNQYVTSANVLDWDQVTAVRVMLLMRSTATVSGETQTYTYNGQTVTAGDRRLRQVFSTTIALRNRI